jgi:hypothetical protein
MSHTWKTIPTTNIVNGSSLNADQSIRASDLRGGSLGRIKATTSDSRPRFINPRTRTVHPNPSFGSSSLTRMGYIIPPKLLPVEAQPMAKDRFLENHVAVTPMHGVKNKPPPMPHRTPCVSSSCQYVVEMLIKKILRTCKVMPTRIAGRK